MTVEITRGNGMTIEEVLADLKRQKLFVSNLYEGVDGIWRCFLRARANDLHFYAAGTGQTMTGAIQNALKKEPPKDRIDRMLE